MEDRTLTMRIKRLRDNAKDLAYAHGKEDSGMDLYVAAIAKKENGEWVEHDKYTLQPNETVLVKTGWAVSIPIGTELQIRPTSGNSLKTKLRIPNSPGTMDAGYRNEIGVIVENIGNSLISLAEGMKIAQAVMVPVLHPTVIEVDNLDETDRGLDGFGSTGTILDGGK